MKDEPSSRYLPLFFLPFFPLLKMKNEISTQNPPLFIFYLPKERKEKKKTLIDELELFFGTFQPIQSREGILGLRVCKIYTKDWKLDNIIDFLSRERNPVIGRQKLDLYRLYFLVTQRGGIEKAILDGKWREVVAGLNISHTITNRSFVLKKHYFKLLFHYEQVYYFRRQGPIVTPPVTVSQRSYPRFRFVNNSEQAMPLLPQPGFDQGSESSGSVPHHLPLGESQPEDVEPLPEDEEDEDVAESDPVPAVPASVENGSGHAAFGDLPSDPALGVDASNGAQSAPSNAAADGDAVPNFVALSPSFRENEPIGAQSFQTDMAAHGIGENMPAGGRSVHNNLGNVNIGSPILHGVLQSQPQPAFSFSAPSTSAAHPQPCRSGYSFFFEERFSMFRNLPSQSMGELVRLIEESWGRLTEAERGVYTDRERVDKERYERELNEYQERIRNT